MLRPVFKDSLHEISFRQNGYVILDLLSPEDVDDLKVSFEPFAPQHRYDFSPSILSLDTEDRRSVHHSIERTLSPRLVPVFDRYEIVLASYAIKNPRSEYSNVGLHQDLSFVREPEEVGISIWCPLVDVYPENGCLFIMPGSQDFNSHFRGPCSLPYRDLVETIEEHYLSPLPMKAGQVLLMDNRLFHASPPNQEDHPRLVAAGVAVPEGTQLLYCHCDSQNEDSIEIFEVPSDFYLRHTIGERPQEGHCTQTLPYKIAPLSAEQLQSSLQPITI